MKKNKCSINNMTNYITWISAYVIAFCLIISTGGAWVNDTHLTLKPDSLRWNILATLILISIFLCFFNSSQKKNFSFTLKKELFLAGLCMLTYLLQTQGDRDAYLNCFLLPIIWFSFFLIQVEEINLIWNAFTNILTLYAPISLFYFLFGTCINLIPESGRTAIIWGTWDTSSVRIFHHLYYEAQFIKTDGAHLVARNCGIFAEAPMYSFVLCIAVAAELFLSKKVHWWKIIILSITIATTFSTTGYLFLIIAFLLYLSEIIFSDKNITIPKKILKKSMIVVVLLIIGILLHKVTTISGAGSVNVRTDHLLACIKAWRESPIIGVGFKNKDAVMYYQNYKQGISIGLPYLFATGGILLSVLVIFPYFITIKEAFKKNFFDVFIFETIFLIIYFFTAVTEDPIFTFFIAYILVNHDIDKEQFIKTDKVRDFLKNKLAHV